MILSFMKFIALVMFLFVVCILPIMYIVYLTYTVIRDKEWRQIRKEKKFYRNNYRYDQNGNKKLNGAWHK